VSVDQTQDIEVLRTLVKMQLARKRPAKGAAGRSADAATREEWAQGRIHHPVVYSLGIHRFDIDEVEDAVERVKSTGRALDPAALTNHEHSHCDVQRVPRSASVRSSRDLGVLAPELREAEGRVVELEDELRQIMSEHARWRESVTEACGLLLEALPVADDYVLLAAEQLGELLKET
jgi:hypothetical protein